MSKTIIAIGGIAGALTAILVLVFLIFPKLKPQPDPNQYGGTLKVTSVEPRINFDTEISRLEVARLGGSGEYHKKYAHSLGAVIRFECTVKGKKDTKYPLRWTMYDAITKIRVDELELNYQPGWPTSNVIQKGSEAQLAGDVWVPYPKREGSFFVTLELIDPDTRRPIATADSTPFNLP